MSPALKVCHHAQYPPGTETVYSYFESRGGKFSETVFFGLQYIIKKRLAGEVVTEAKIAQAKSISLEHFGMDLFNEDGWRHIVKSAALGGLAHLVSFRGTDSMAAVLLGRAFYHCPMAGFSIPATEHSTVTVWGEEHESDAYSHLLDTYYDGTFACVSDSYDLWNACKNLWGDKLRDRVVERDGTLVIRPDSGDPIQVVPKLLEILGQQFTNTLNTKGYKMLPDCVRIIQGDGISLQSLSPILESIKDSGWSTENVNFGSGGGLLQQFNRDTQKCAFKCSHVVIHGEESNVFKHPITDPNKTSKKGRLTLERSSSDGKYHTIEEGQGDLSKDLLIPVFENGILLIDHTLEEIRARADLPSE